MAVHFNNVELKQHAMGKSESEIYELRGHKVMIDRCLAKLFGVKTRTLKQAVRRNLKRFPEDFMFEMSDAEFRDWQLSHANGMELPRAPLCFTEQGVKMLSCVLTSELAIETNIIVIRVFVKLKRLLDARGLI